MFAEEADVGRKTECGRREARRGQNARRKQKAMARHSACALPLELSSSPAVAAKVARQIAGDVQARGWRGPQELVSLQLVRHSAGRGPLPNQCAAPCAAPRYHLRGKQLVIVDIERCLPIKLHMSKPGHSVLYSIRPETPCYFISIPSNAHDSHRTWNCPSCKAFASFATDG